MRLLHDTLAQFVRSPRRESQVPSVIVPPFLASRRTTSYIRQTPIDSSLEYGPSACSKPSPARAKNTVPRLSMHVAESARVFLVATALLGVTPTSVMAQARYVAPDQTTIRTSMAAMPGQVNTKVVRVENLSTVPVVVTQVMLVDCNNVGYVCGMNQMEITVEPGKRKTVLEVEPAVISRTVSFGYRFRWRHKSREAILGTLANAGDSAAAMRLAQVRSAEAGRSASARPGEAELYSHELVALGDRVAMLRADPDSVVIPVGGAITTSMLRIIAVDSSGASLGRLRASYRFSLERGPAVSLARPDSLLGLAPGRQTLTVRLPVELSAGRATPFSELRFTIIVP